MKNIIILPLLILTHTLVAQHFSVKGTVRDEEGESLPGVNVLIEGSDIGTITGIEGDYAIEVPGKDAVLVFSYVGMETTIEVVNDRSIIDVTLKTNIQELESVMIVAYGTSSKAAFTGAAETVDKEVIENRPVTSFEKALQGTTSGLLVTSSSGQPGAGSTLKDVAKGK